VRCDTASLYRIAAARWRAFGISLVVRKMSSRTKKIIASILIIGAVYLINDALTPKPCKVKPDHMSQFCKDLMYP